ncbi:hypothetical protein FO519_006150 [Halicephalobus sp. NKZ332]|nr:hypothetical protein FO519_006150 [Halicephalobus sp. NKZ332]
MTSATVGILVLLAVVYAQSAPVSPQGSNLENSRPNVFEPRGRPTLEKEDPEEAQEGNDQSVEKPQDEREIQIPEKPDPDTVDENGQKEEKRDVPQVYDDQQQNADPQNNNNGDNQSSQDNNNGGSNQTAQVCGRDYGKNDY